MAGDWSSAVLTFTDAGSAAEPTWTLTTPPPLAPSPPAPATSKAL
ncbi:hypothetical protein ABLE91_01110 [Aquabacter sp. CN5-332]